MPRLNPEQLLALAEALVDDLVEMDAGTAISLDTWPNAARLVEALRPRVAPRSEATT